MPELHLRCFGLIYSACELFTKHRKSIKKFKEAADLKYIYRNELDKLCVDHDT